MQGAFANARDVGGLPVSGGREVRSGVLYRSDAPFPQDIAPDNLVPWPPHLVLDLREPDELVGPHPLSLTGAVVESMPMSARAALATLTTPIERLDLATLYAVMIKEKAQLLVRIAEKIAEAPGPVLIHCTAGKDRTGVTVATMLSAVGVPRDQIVADYITTDTNMPAVLERMMADAPRNGVAAADRVKAIPREMLGAPAVAIEVVLDVFETHPDGAAGWLIDQGLSAATLRQLEERLVR